MPLNVDSFRNLVGQTHYGNRDIVVSGEGKNASDAELGDKMPEFTIDDIRQADI